MSLFLSNDNHNDLKINLDELYERTKKNDHNTLLSYNKILLRIHTRIRTTSRQKNNQQCCWFIVPEMIIGIPKFDTASCIAYIIDKLTENDFKVKYTHPNLLFISWNHWIPDYVREKIKKNTGMDINGNGELKKKIRDNMDDDLGNTLLTKSNTNAPVNKEYKSINSYKPNGGLIYDTDMLNSVQKKL
tara:strand:+ start:3767 stop:4330 length:564 start_codon:yes stop_codon:yes gene_type:complete